LPEAAATSVHVVKVSLHDAFPPVWRRLELPSAMTLDRLHEIAQEVFNWNGFHSHAFETAYGEFGSPSSRGSSDRSDEAAVALAQVAGEEGAEMVYVYGIGDDWRHDIVVEKIVPAAPGVAYPRCTAGRGTQTPDEDSGGIWAFNAQRAEDAADDPALSYSVDEIDAEVETEMLAYLAMVIVPGS
jgi:Plasmid pRiA4b ORF-3-like protein